MKKTIFAGIVVAIALAASFTAFAYSSDSHADCNHSEAVEVAAQGTGACTHPNCKCTKFNQRPGYYQCWCGHQSYVHK